MRGCVPDQDVRLVGKVLDLLVEEAVIRGQPGKEDEPG